MLNDENSMTASGSAQSESTTELHNTGTVPEKSATRRHRAATRAAGAPAESSAGESSASVPVTTAAGSGGAVVTSAAETVDLPRPRPDDVVPPALLQRLSKPRKKTRMPRRETSSLQFQRLPRLRSSSLSSL